jgi:hypothetical protein
MLGHNGETERNYVGNRKNNGVQSLRKGWNESHSKYVAISNNFFITEALICVSQFVFNLIRQTTYIERHMPQMAWNFGLGILFSNEKRCKTYFRENVQSKKDSQDIFLGTAMLQFYILFNA